ncbi:MAG TPA: hypothetical protein VH741_06455, partial [Candidatus Limnocylindrales bacterium]
MAGLLTTSSWVPGIQTAYAGSSSTACAFADSETPTECVISAAWTQGGGGVGANQFSGAGPFSFKKTLHITGTGSINSPIVGISLQIDGTLSGGMPGDAYAGATGGPGHLLMDAGAFIQAHDTSSANGGGPVTVTTSGDVVMQADSLISTQNTVSAGSGGPVVLDVNGDKMVMCGPSGAIDAACGGPSANPGAAIITDAPQGGGSPGSGGDVTIDVGDFPNSATGVFLMEDGTAIQANGLNGAGGVIKITAGLSAVIDGDVLSQVVDGLTGTGNSATAGYDGREISIKTGCGLEVGGLISSFGRDHGAERVHLESCEVKIKTGGIVESSGSGGNPGHGLPGTNNPNHCGPNYPSTADQSDFRPDKPRLSSNTDRGASAACIEVWAKVIKVQQGGIIRTTPIGNSWIDLLATEFIKIEGQTGSTDPFAVQVNDDTFGGQAGIITVKVKNGPFYSSGRALQATASGQGGDITVEAEGTTSPCCQMNPQPTGVALGSSTIEARATGTSNGFGGNIDLVAYQGDVTGNGVLNTAGAGGGGQVGTVDLRGCTDPATTYTGTVTGTRTDTTGPCAGEPSFQDYVVFNRNGIWTECGEFTIGGLKFNDQTNNGENNGEPGLADWDIHVTGPDSYDNTVSTGSDGSWSLTLPGPGTYTVCEVLETNWQQTFPTSGAACGSGEGEFGYQVELGASACCGGDMVTGLDFGNFSAAQLRVTTQVHNENHQDVTNGSVPLGSTVHDTAVLSGAVDGFPPPAITFTFYDNSTCDGDGLAVANIGPDESSGDDRSADVGPLGAGQYSFKASVEGNDNYIGDDSDCEPFTV